MPHRKSPMTGKIVKGIAGFYYVTVVGSGIYECKAKGIFRKEGRKPLVGDLVEIEVLDEEAHEANLVELLPRQNSLVRPAVANVDQAMLLMSMKDPSPNRVLIDRFLLMMEEQKVPAFLVFNKEDLAVPEKMEELRRIYSTTGYPLFFCSIKEELDTEVLRAQLQGRTTVLAGPSGVGKSSFTNLMQQGIRMETGGISKKLGRGRHTTRHSELIYMGEDTWICDTPGFSSLFLLETEKEDLRWYYPEFQPMEGSCRFQGCVHMDEPDCSVKAAVEKGEVSPERYENYRMFFEELKEKEKRRY